MLPSWMGRMAGIAAVLIATATAGATVIQETEIDLSVDPNGGSMAVRTRLHIAENAADPQFLCYFLQPARLDYFRETSSGRDVPYTLEQVSLPEYSISTFTMNLSQLPPECVLELAYSYTAQEFYGHGLNPATMDALVFGQITPESVFSSHLYYYPNPGIGTGRGRIAITSPPGWTAVTAGVLKSREPLDGGLCRFTYDIPYASGLLPYPLAIYPYAIEETVYRDRFPVSVYCSSDDVTHAREKMAHVTTKVLPFLEELMGDYPWPSLRVVEVFPREGNTGLAAKGVVIMSKALWFAAPIGDSYLSLQATILVDEIAHQWNAYRAQLPNFLAEGVSEYTDNLFMERFVSRDVLAANMAEYRKQYADMAALLNRLKTSYDANETIEQAAKTLGASVEAITSYWPYAPWGELPISDPQVFPSLYFLKGALAIHALRTELGDEQFFRGFKSVFTQAGDAPLTLDYYRRCFESAHGGSLAAFFQLWYNEPGLPEK